MIGHQAIQHEVGVSDSAPILQCREDEIGDNVAREVRAAIRGVDSDVPDQARNAICGAIQAYALAVWWISGCDAVFPPGARVLPIGPS
jgi:hypothetical protein